jgi:hypothetical protein
MGLCPKPPAFSRARSARERRIAKRRNFHSERRRGATGSRPVRALSSFGLPPVLEPNFPVGPSSVMK